MYPAITRTRGLLAGWILECAKQDLGLDHRTTQAAKDLQHHQVQQLMADVVRKAYLFEVKLWISERRKLSLNCSQPRENREPWSSGFSSYRRLERREAAARRGAAAGTPFRLPRGRPSPRAPVAAAAAGGRRPPAGSARWARRGRYSPARRRWSAARPGRCAPRTRPAIAPPWPARPPA